jgi:hypothetical protein
VKYINNPEQFEAFLKNQAKTVCDFGTNEIYEAINYCLNQYYTEWTPDSYNRTEQLLRSAFKTTAKWNGNGFIAEVGIDFDSLDYDEATGFDVVSWANQSGIHGGLDVSSEGADTRVFDDAVDMTIRNGQLLRDVINLLKSKGITVIT